MKPLHKYILLLLFLNILLLGTGYFLTSVANLNLIYSDIAILSLVFSIITLTTLVIFLRGQTKKPGSQTLYSLVSVSLKFLLELVLALVWFIVAKKTSLPSVLIFFVLYLTLTLFSIWVILKTLKNKSL
ncbi:MAG: hypothetical protein NTV31_02780 [Bacteroidia bacterium]|nr:hypothetical protein [Bacteroidia bacterium]